MNIFDLRNKRKKSIEKYATGFYPKKKEIRYVSLGKNIGAEENGKGKNFVRPALLLKKLGNMYLIVPMTTQGKDNNIFYKKLPEIYFKKSSYIITSQPKVVDKKRFKERISKLSDIDFLEITKKLQEFWF